MIADLIYRCPSCTGFGYYHRGSCRYCGAKLSLPSRETLRVDDHEAPIAYWVDKIDGFPLPRSETGPILQSDEVHRFEEARSGVFHGLCDIFAVRYTRRRADNGRLELWCNRLMFIGQMQTMTFDFSMITSITIESNTLIVVSRNFGAQFFDFTHASGKMWEDCLKKALARWLAPGRLLETYPRIRLIGEKWENPRSFDQSPFPPDETHLTGRCAPNWLYRGVRFALRWIVRAFFSIHIDGLDKIPARGAGVLVANHGSILDGIVLCLFPKRDVCFITKNAPYEKWFLRWFLRQSKSIPVRRYRTDPTVIRNALRVVQRGELLGLFPEGERNWDDRLLPFKLGSMRLILALGLPIIPVGISGTYALMPRWTNRIRRVQISIGVGEPFRLDRIALRRQTRRDLERAADRIRAEIRAACDPTASEKRHSRDSE